MKDKGREGLINIGMNRCGREGERNVDSVVLEREGMRREGGGGGRRGREGFENV